VGLFSALDGWLEGGLLRFATTMWFSSGVYVSSSSCHGYGLKVTFTSAFFFFRLHHLYRYRFRSFTFCLGLLEGFTTLDWVGLGWVGYRGSRGGRIPHAHHFFFTMHSNYISLHSIHHHRECCILQLPSSIYHPPLSPKCL